MDETTRLFAEIKEDFARKDETYRLIADSKPGKDCQCKSCKRARCTTCGGTGRFFAFSIAERTGRDEYWDCNCN